MTKKVSITTREQAEKAPVSLGHSGGGASAKGWHNIEAFLRCPKEYQLKVVRGVYSPQDSTPDHFAFGSLFHAARAQWFADKFDTSHAEQERIRLAVEKEAEDARLPVSVEAVRKVLYHMEEYVLFWQKRPRPTPLACEYPLGPSPLQEGDASELWRTARLDDVSFYPEAGGRLCIGEAKTASTSVADVDNQYDLHGQPMLQLALWATSQNGEAQHGPVAGYVLDVCIKTYTAGKKPTFGRVFKPVPAFATQWYIKSMQFYAQAAARVEWDSDVPRNPGVCTRMAGRARVACEFRELCKHGRAASIKYVLPGGKSLLSHKPEEGKTKNPWE